MFLLIDRILGAVCKAQLSTALNCLDLYIYYNCSLDQDVIIEYLEKSIIKSINMNIYTGGKKDHIKKLNSQRADELNEVQESELPKKEKPTRIQKIIANYNQLIKDSYQSLFLQDRIKYIES